MNTVRAAAAGAADGPAGSPPLLSVEALSVAYGGIRAVRDLDLKVRAGEVVALIGANGAGKTTSLKAVAGLLAPAAGRVRLAGEDVTAWPAHRRLAAGLSLVPEGRGTFARMTVRENLDVGAHVRRDRAVGADIERMFALFPRLAERAQQLAGTLSGGEQQLLALARALMSRPRLLLLDEPSMGLAPVMVDRIYDTIRQVSADGVTILLVEQNARLALELASRAYVMSSGGIELEGEAAALAVDPRVRAAYLGEG